MTILVLDASVALAAVLPEPNSSDAQAILKRVIDDGAVVPTLWCLEVGNTLLVAERCARLPLETTRPYSAGLPRCRSWLTRKPRRVHGVKPSNPASVAA